MIAPRRTTFQPMKSNTEAVHDDWRAISDDLRATLGVDVVPTRQSSTGTAVAAIVIIGLLLFVGAGTMLVLDAIGLAVLR